MSNLLKSLAIQSDNNSTYIALPNGEVIEFTELDNALYVDHREQLGGDSLGAVCINMSANDCRAARNEHREATSSMATQIFNQDI
ncbi:MULTISPECIES: hypothetical protein [Vibrio]|uniref:hypothetical protein n=1 Tax=Vibrio TaxID=662 RepID=UPI002075F33C|nr:MULTISPECIES: hypothetical protein [Vibrio]USD35452.1 hypothetical protein J8Z27_22800 [Vibrio sp. SCSIO 43186]USD72576.1 hypothetical protein J4N41_22805 [Vibrio sp. SCSIO 43139]USD98970.1 hypothetical protein CTT30_23130 [Vibrio coralliilyticus]